MMNRHQHHRNSGGDLLDLLDMGPVPAVRASGSGGDALVADALGDIFGGDPVVPPSQPSRYFSARI